MKTSPLTRSSLRVTEAVELLQRKATPEEVASYKKFVGDVAERVAEAHHEHGEAVSDAERAAMEKISAALNSDAA